MLLNIKGLASWEKSQPGIMDFQCSPEILHDVGVLVALNGARIAHLTAGLSNRNTVS